MPERNNGNEVQCDECQEAFAIKLKEKHYPKTVIETYFTCPSCDMRYTTHVTNKWVREEQKKIVKLRDEYYRRRTKMQTVMDKLREEIKAST